MTIRIFTFVGTLILFTACSVGTSTVPKGYESQKRDSDKIDSIIKNYLAGVYKLHINGRNLNLTLGMTSGDIAHFRRRRFYVDRLIFQMSNYMDSINLATIKVSELPDLTKTHDTYTYTAAQIQNVKSWPEKDPIYLYFMSLVAAMNNEKYEEFASVAHVFSNEFEDEKGLSTFDPDLAYYIDKFVSEMYGEPRGIRQRHIMEAFYESTFDQEFKPKHIKPSDILQFTNYADSVYYLKAFPNEMKALLDKRLKPN